MDPLDCSSSETPASPTHDHQPQAVHRPQLGFAIAGSVSIGGVVEVTGSASLHVARCVVVIGLVLLLLLGVYLLSRSTARVASSVTAPAGSILFW
jgi:hypothetical protein